MCSVLYSPHDIPRYLFAQLAGGPGNHVQGLDPAPGEGLGLAITSDLSTCVPDKAHFSARRLDRRRLHGSRIETQPHQLGEMLGAQELDEREVAVRACSCT